MLQEVSIPVVDWIVTQRFRWAWRDITRDRGYEDISNKPDFRGKEIVRFNVMRYFLNKLLSHLLECHKSVRLLRQYQTFHNMNNKRVERKVNEYKSLRIFKNKIQICPLQSVLIFSILNHPCSFRVFYYHFDVFLS